MMNAVAKLCESLARLTPAQPVAPARPVNWLPENLPQAPHAPTTNPAFPDPVRLWAADGYERCTIGPVSIDGVLIADGQAWVTQRQMATLFGVSRSNVAKHICAILEENELKASAVCERYSLTAADERNYDTTHYTPDMVMAVGFRIKSPRGVEYRQWVLSVLKGETAAPRSTALAPVADPQVGQSIALLTQMMHRA